MIPVVYLRSDHFVDIMVRIESRNYRDPVASSGRQTRLSELIERACSEGPQTITRHGTERAVVLSIADYRELAASRPDFKAHLLGGPKVEDFPLERDADTGRPVVL
jgi:antitoxin Phd